MSRKQGSFCYTFGPAVYSTLFLQGLKKHQSILKYEALSKRVYSGKYKDLREDYPPKVDVEEI